MPGKNQLGSVGLGLNGYEGAFSVELHEYDVEVAFVGDIHALINP